MTNNKKLVLRVSSNCHQLFNDLQVRTNSSSIGEVLRQALALLDTISREQAEGNEVYILKDGGYAKVVWAKEAK